MPFNSVGSQYAVYGVALQPVWGSMTPSTGSHDALYGGRMMPCEGSHDALYGVAECFCRDSVQDFWWVWLLSVLLPSPYAMCCTAVAYGATMFYAICCNAIAYGVYYGLRHVSY
eukprot:2714381-Rhodomonas_salina.4